MTRPKGAPGAALPAALELLSCSPKLGRMRRGGSPRVWRRWNSHRRTSGSCASGARNRPSPSRRWPPLWECRADWWRWWTNFETRGLVERRANPDDRPSPALHLTEEGRAMLELSGRVGREHRQALLAALNDDEQGPTRGPAAVRSFTPGYRPDFGLDTVGIGRRTGWEGWWRS